MKHIQLTRGLFAIVDDEDFDHLSAFKWQATRCGQTVGFYAQRGVKIAGRNTGFMMHREILGLVHGDGKIADHINGDKLDNRRSNLRVVSSVENARNCRSHSRYGIKGVWKTPGGRWSAEIQKSGFRYRLGTFDTPELAHQAYCVASRKHHGEFGRLA